MDEAERLREEYAATKLNARQKAIQMAADWPT